MKLLYLHEALGSLGGAEANVLITATEFSKRGVEVGLVTQKETGKNTEKWKALFRDNIFYYDQAEPSEIIDKFQPNVVYTHKWSHLPTLENWVKCDIPMARMVHDHESYCLRGYKYFPVSREICRKPAGLHCVFPCLAMLKINRGKFPPVELQSYSEKLKEISLCRQMDAQFVVTDYMQNELLINGFSEEKIHIFPPVPREVEPVNSTYSDRNLIIFAGQIIRGKGVDLLVKALSQMKEPFECVVLGEGSHQSRCQQLCDELQVADKVRFAGFIPQRELQGYYIFATVLVVPYVWPEPFAKFGLEAMKSG
ncbi:MAG: glycosyltransferase family 4 protein, partial [Verrucomicrobiota bacterium]